jgi:hypothetical protein
VDPEKLSALIDALRTAGSLEPVMVGDRAALGVELGATNSAPAADALERLTQRLEVAAADMAAPLPGAQVVATGELPARVAFPAVPMPEFHDLLNPLKTSTDNTRDRLWALWDYTPDGFKFLVEWPLSAKVSGDLLPPRKGATGPTGSVAMKFRDESTVYNISDQIGGGANFTAAHYRAEALGLDLGVAEASYARPFAWETEWQLTQPSVNRFDGSGRLPGFDELLEGDRITMTFPPDRPNTIELGAKVGKLLKGGLGGFDMHNDFASVTVERGSGGVSSGTRDMTAGFVEARFGDEVASEYDLSAAVQYWSVNGPIDTRTYWVSPGPDTFSEATPLGDLSRTPEFAEAISAVINEGKIITSSEARSGAAGYELPDGALYSDDLLTFTVRSLETDLPNARVAFSGANLHPGATNELLVTQDRSYYVHHDAARSGDTVPIGTDHLTLRRSAGLLGGDTWGTYLGSVFTDNAFPALMSINRYDDTDGKSQTKVDVVGGGVKYSFTQGQLYEGARLAPDSTWLGTTNAVVEALKDGQSLAAATENASNQDLIDAARQINDALVAADRPGAAIENVPLQAPAPYDPAYLAGPWVESYPELSPFTPRVEAADPSEFDPPGPVMSSGPGESFDPLDASIASSDYGSFAPFDHRSFDSTDYGPLGSYGFGSLGSLDYSWPSDSFQSFDSFGDVSMFDSFQSFDSFGDVSMFDSFQSVDSFQSFDAGTSFDSLDVVDYSYSAMMSMDY